MGMVIDAIGEWLKEILVSGIIGNLSGLFDARTGRWQIFQRKSEPRRRRGTLRSTT